MWGIVNQQRGKSKTVNTDFTDIVRCASGEPFPTKKGAVNAMNSRFVHAAAACGAPAADPARVLSALSAVRAPADRSLRLRPFTPHEVHRIIVSRIPPKPSKDAYGISMRLMCVAAAPIAPVLASLFNQCIEGGVYPEPLKLSKVSPLFKGKGKPHDIDAYRPVSIIPAVAKVFENGLCSRLVDYLTSMQALSHQQYAYREGRSTTSLTREVIRRVMDARESKQHVAVLCCDLSKAFDVADHEVLAIKMRHYGIVNAPLNLLSSMLRDRSQIVVGAGGVERSDPLFTKMGVAQGSSISNILFSLLLNDLPNSICAAEVMMYADDVAAVVTAPSIDQLERNLNSAACQLAGWFRVNGLVLNLTKTHFIHFCLSGHYVRNLSVFADGIKVEQADRTTFLGFEIDRGLTWEYHINKLCGKLGGACFALYRLSSFLPREVVRSCYFATVQSLLQYGTELWGRAADWERAFRMQKRAIRAIVRVPRDTSVRPFFKELGILTLPSLIIFQVAVHVRTNLDSFKKLGDSHAYSTRRAGQLSAVPRTMAKSNKLTHVMGPAVYNRIPKMVTEAINTNMFKSRLKRWLVEQTFYTFDEFTSLKSS